MSRKQEYLNQTEPPFVWKYCMVFAVTFFFKDFYPFSIFNLSDYLSLLVTIMLQHLVLYICFHVFTRWVCGFHRKEETLSEGCHSGMYPLASLTALKPWHQPTACRLGNHFVITLCRRADEEVTSPGAEVLFISTTTTVTSCLTLIYLTWAHQHIDRLHQLLINI